MTQSTTNTPAANTDQWAPQTVWDRPSIEHSCGCVTYPHFTEGRWVDNFGDGPRQWQWGTAYEGYTDTSGCTEGHDRE